MLYTRIDILCANKIVYVIFWELSISGRVVARVCSEYIPQIDKTKRVTVVYPVFNNKVKYNLGYFIGNEGLAPTRVCWNDTTATSTLLPLSIPKARVFAVLFSIIQPVEWLQSTSP